MRTPGDKAAFVAGSRACRRGESNGANPHRDKRTRLHKAWREGWKLAERNKREADKLRHAHGHPLDRKAINAAVKRAKATVSPFDATKGKTSRVHGERGYMIFNKHTNRILCHIGVFEWLSGAAVDRRNRQKTTKTKLGICRVTVTVSGRTW